MNSSTTLLHLFVSIFVRLFSVFYDYLFSRTEAMQLMVEGDKWELYIPSELAYGDSGSPPKIKPGDVLIFRMEIVKINGDKVSFFSFFLCYFGLFF